jgi:Cation transport ATPase
MALLSFAREKLGLAPVGEKTANAKGVQIFPFDSSRKCVAVVDRIDNGMYRMLVKGAAEILLRQSTQILRDPTNDQADAALSDEKRTTLETIISKYASRSLRSIALPSGAFEQWPPMEHRRTRMIAEWQPWSQSSRTWRCYAYSASRTPSGKESLKQSNSANVPVLLSG